jgi:hypothetical protein
MDKLPARTGWEWVKQGFALFRKQSLGLAVLFFSYMVFTFWIGLLPLVGKMLSFTLIPFFSVAFMQGCANADQGKRVHPALLLAGFRSPVKAALFRLGLIYLGVAVVAAALSTFIDDGVLVKVLMRQIEADSAEVKNSAIGAAILFTGLIQLVTFAMLAFSAPLVYWKQMGVGKAVFYSVFGIIGATKPFMLFALSWFGISTIVGQIVLLIVGQTEALGAVLVPVSLIYMIIVFCSFYAIYCQLFGAPETEPVAKEPVTPDA